MAKEDLDLDVESATEVKKPGKMKLIIIGVAGELARLHRADPILGPLSDPTLPTTDADPPGYRQIGDQVFRADRGDLRVERSGQRRANDLRADAARVAERHRQARGHGRRSSAVVPSVRMST